jgi:hypothetical protein
VQPTNLSSGTIKYKSSNKEFTLSLISESNSSLIFLELNLFYSTFLIYSKTLFREDAEL